MQISFYNGIRNNVICCEYTALNKDRTYIEITSLNDLDKVLEMAWNLHCNDMKTIKHNTLKD